MKDQIMVGEVFQSHDFSEKGFVIGEYDGCSFLQCDFSGIDFSQSVFTDCIFEGCNLSLAKLKGTSFGKVTFSNCKVMGVHFETCNPFMFTVIFEHCVLDLSSFHGMRIPSMKYLSCSMREVDLTNADLSGSIFTGSDLQLAVFQQTNLEKSDLSGAVHFEIDPSRNKIKKAKFSRDGLEGLLGGYDIRIID